MFPISIINQYGNYVARDEYKLFTDELTSDSTNKLITSNQSYSAISSGASYNRVYMYGTNAASGTMWGTPYNSRMTWDSTFYRVIQHCFPTEALFTDFISSTNNSRVVCLVRSVISTGSTYTGITRNGYTSANYGSYSGCTVTDFIYYDVSTARVMRYNPSIANTPTYYYNY